MDTAADMRRKCVARCAARAEAIAQWENGGRDEYLASGGLWPALQLGERIAAAADAAAPKP